METTTIFAQTRLSFQNRSDKLQSRRFLMILPLLGYIFLTILKAVQVLLKGGKGRRYYRMTPKWTISRRS